MSTLVFRSAGSGILVERLKLVKTFLVEAILREQAHAGVMYGVERNTLYFFCVQSHFLFWHWFSIFFQSRKFGNNIV